MNGAENRPKRYAGLVAVFTLICKFPQAMGVLLYWYRRLSSGQPTLIEYK